ncbi:MAG: hypothetical protein HOW73_22650 [Polyangiaceae bacterium]|nr:hypothetical protein [Polyangiaceae bacterium]
MKLYSPDPPQPPAGPYPHCDCFRDASKQHQSVPAINDDVQDTSCDAWREVVARIERAARDGTEELSLLDGMSGADRARIITLPPIIGELTRLRTLKLYSSHFCRIPPEIGAMRALEYLDIYTSYRLHFLPSR